MKKIILILLSSFLALLFFEFFLKYSPFEYGVSAAEYDKTIGMWHKKNFEDYIVDKCYKTKYSYNDKGLPSNIDPYDPKKKDVIILGDSFIEARMVNNENIIHNSLAKAFNYKYNFLNYGLFGTGPTQQFIILKEKVDLNNTKYVIQFIELEGDLLDVESKNSNSLARPKVYVEFETLDKYKVIPPRKKTLYDTVSDALSYYQVYPFIKQSIYSLKTLLSTTSKEMPNEKKSNQKTDEEIDLSKNWLYLKGAIYQTDKLIASLDNNIEYKIIVRSKGKKAQNQENKKIIEKFLNEHHINFIFLNDVAKSMNIELKGFKCDSHWNDKAHQDVAKIIKETEFIK